MSALKVCNSCGREYHKVEDFFIKTSRWRMCQSDNLWFNCSCDSTNLILKGKFPWYRPEAKLSQRARSTFHSIAESGDLPQLPTYVMELQILVQQEQTNARQVAELVKKAPAFATRILAIANQLSQLKGSKIESLEHAVAYIGIQALQDIILVAGLQSITIQTQTFSIDEFWNDAFMTGQITEKLAHRLAPHILPDQAYIAGTLCNIGKLVLAIVAPAQADQIASDLEATKTLGTWQDVESRHKIATHLILGEIGGSFWGMPDYVLDAIMLHHSHPKQKLRRASLEGLVAIANQVNHWVQLRPSRLEEKTLQAWQKALQVDSKTIEGLVAEMLELKAA